MKHMIGNSAHMTHANLVLPTIVAMKLLPDHDSRCRSSVSGPQTVWLQAFFWLLSDQHTGITDTKAEPAFIRKKQISTPSSNELWLDTTGVANGNGLESMEYTLQGACSELSLKKLKDEGFEFTPSRSEVVFLKLSGIGNSAFLLAAAFAYLFTRILAPDSIENRRLFRHLGKETFHCTSDEYIATSAELGNIHTALFAAKERMNLPLFRLPISIEALDALIKKVEEQRARLTPVYSTPKETVPSDTTLNSPSKRTLTPDKRHTAKKIARQLAPTLISKLTGKFLRITVQSDDEYRKLAQFLRHEGVEYKSFMLKSDRPLKLLIHGLPTSTKVEEIRVEIEREGFQIHKISRLQKFKTKAPMPLIYLQLIANDEGVDEELLARAFRAALRKLPHPDDKACEIFQAYVALKNGHDRVIFPRTRTAGGTAIYCKSNFVQSRAPLPGIQYMDATTIEIKINNFPPLRVVSAYARFCAEINRKLPEKDFLKILNSGNNLIIAGDLNAAHKTWNNTRSNNFGFRLKRIIQNYPNARIVAPYTPTHINSRSRPEVHESIIDLAVFKNIPFNYDIRVIDDLCSDHPLVILTLYTNSDTMKIPAQLTTNWENFRFLLKHKPLPIPVSPRKEHLGVAIGRLGENISEALVAASKPKFKIASIKLPPDIRSKIRHRNRGALGSIAVVPIEKAEVIADSLQKQFEPNTDVENPRFSAHIQRKVQRFLDSPTCMDLEKTSPSEIQGFIKNLKPNKSPGIDLITNRILKNLPTKFIIFIALLFNMLLENCYFPKSCRMAVVIPILKPNSDDSNPQNYHPISLLSSLSKAYEFELWFQQDGATCHTARATIDLSKDTLGDRLISRFGPVNWPPRSCDLTPLDYFLWGYVKSLVYADNPQTLDHLEDNIRHVIADIRPQMLEKVIDVQIRLHPSQPWQSYARNHI
ncbi:RNA-directed DNA polymerase from mobile element jockey [Trichonephila clavipes]|nr:RNA-directed DNA polymerase from mobile element jockey [Trichonephila clavipes]